MIKNGKGLILVTHQRLSVCMIVKDEEKRLPTCLESIRPVVDELIIVDTGSTDKTYSIARDFGATLFSHPWSHDFSEARNFSLSKASGEWILYVDADEILSPVSKVDVQTLLNRDMVEGYYVIIESVSDEEITFDTTVHPSLRLFRNRPEYRFEGALHEQIAPGILKAGHGKLAFSDLRLLHFGYDSRDVHNKAKLSRNRDILLAELRKDPHNSFNRYNLGMEYMRVEDYDHALEEFQLAFKYLPGLDVAYASRLVRNIVVCLRALGRPDEGLKVIEDADGAFNGFTDLEYLKGVLFLESNKPEAAIASFQRAISMGESAPIHISESGVGSYKAWYASALALEKLADFNRANQALEHALRVNPRFAPAAEHLIRKRLRDVSVEEALEVARELSDFNDASVLVSVARALRDSGYSAQARALLERAESPSMVINIARAETEIVNKNFTEAIQIAVSMEDESGFIPSRLAEVAIVAATLLWDDSAPELISRFLPRLPSNLSAVYGAWLRIRLGHSLSAPGEDGKNDRDMVQPVWNLLRLLLQLHEFERFEEALTLLEWAGVSELERHLGLGKLYFELGFVESTVDEFLAVNDLEKLDADAQMILGGICVERGMIEDGLALLESAVRLDPDNERRLEVLTAALFKAGRASEAMRLLESKLRNKEPVPSRGATLVEV